MRVRVECKRNMCYFLRQEALNTGVESACERREEARTRTEGLSARLTDIYRDRLPVAVVNISRSGLAVMVEDKFTVGFPVLLECKGLLIVGNVRHCVNTADGRYVLGIKAQKVVDTTGGGAVLELAHEGF